MAKLNVKSNAKEISYTFTIPNFEALMLVHLMKKIVRKVLPTESAVRLNGIIDDRANFIGEEFECISEWDACEELNARTDEVARALIPAKAILEKASKYL